jgi:uncharacterized protein
VRGGTGPAQTVTVSGTVAELFNMTMIEAAGQTPTFSGKAKQSNLPAPVVIDPAAAEAQSIASNGTRPYYESLEGMRVELAVGTADSGGTDKFGELYLVPGKVRNLVTGGYTVSQGPPALLDTYQDAGSADLDPTDPSAEPASTTRVNANLFDRVTGPTAYPPEAPVAKKGTLRVANFNMENLFGVGMVDDGHTFTAEEIDAKTTRLANAIRGLHRPDVIAVEEVASEEPLQKVAGELGGYQVIWEPSNDERHVAVGYLVAESIDVTDVRQLGKEATTPITGCNDNPSPLGLAGPPRGVPRSAGRLRRRRVKALEAAGGSVMVIGDLNAFRDSPSMATLAAGTTLRDLLSKAPAEDRYSFQFDGLLETLDHIFLTKMLAKQVEEIRYVHFDNDYFEPNETTSPIGVSDPDPPVVRLTIPTGGLG